jgi:cobalt-zinc-cadmium efflux system outer membrane protein
MKIRLLQVLAIVTFCTQPASVTAAEPGKEPLTLARVIELSATNAPEVRLANNQVAIGKVKLAGARVRTLENPKLDLVVGPRTSTQTSVDLELGMEIPIELGNRRGRRIAVAQAGIRRGIHATEDVRRQAVAAAVGAYYRVLQAGERLGLARDRKTLADDLFRIAKERHLAGDAAKFEVNLAQTEVARAGSDISSAQGRVALARAALARTLGLPSGAELQIVGSSRDRTFFDTLQSAPGSSGRADYLAALADVEVSRATISLAEAERLPDLAFRLSYQREGNDNVALGGISVSLPFLNPREAPVQEARVLHQRARIAAEISQAAVTAELEGARSAYDAAVEAVRHMETDALPLQQENESLARESYRAGKIGLTTLLQVRRDALETRREYLERLLEAAEAGVELASASGRWSTVN